MKPSRRALETPSHSTLIIVSLYSAMSTSDPTFRAYSASEAKTYATHRLSYSPDLYSTILSHHGSTGGHFSLLLDVGCGPGNATRDLALSFDEAIGCDPGEQMIAAANELGGKTRSGEDVRFVVAGAEELSEIEALRGGSVDLLVAAMAVSFLGGLMRCDGMGNIDECRRIGLRCLSFGRGLREL